MRSKRALIDENKIAAYIDETNDWMITMESAE